MTGTDCCILIFSKFLAIINVRSDIKEQACLHQKALLLRIGGLFLRCCDSSVGARRQLLRLSANRLTSDQLVRVLDPPKVGR